MRRWIAAAAATVALGMAASGAPQKARPPSGSAAKPRETQQSRLAQARQSLTQADRASKNAKVKKGIAESLALLDRKDFAAAARKVGDLKGTAATAGDSSDAVLKLLDAENVLREMAERKAAREKKR